MCPGDSSGEVTNRYTAFLASKNASHALQAIKSLL